VWTDIDDAELVRRYLDSDDLRCFDELVLRHRERVMRMVLSVLGPELAADAEDVVQETFLRAHDRLAGFRGHSRFGTWLYRVAYNRALDQRRAIARRARRGSSQVAETDAAVSESPSAPSRILADEQNRALHKALVRIPQPGQTVLRAHYWLELSVGEIAELLGVPAGTVKSYLHRGRARLARLLQSEGVAR